MRKIDIPIGTTFGNLVVISEVGEDSKYLCRCVCGAEKIVRSGELRYGKTLSCGCLRKKVISNLFSTHGLSKTPTYIIWKSMRKRCLNPGVNDAIHYQGVTVCERWNSFENFLADMGERPEGMSIDRIDSSGNYEPGNCRWASKKTQAINRSNTRFITFKGRTMCISDWAKSIGISRKGLVRRLDAGWSIDDALTIKNGEKKC